MKNIKRISLIIALVLAFSSMFCVASFAHEDEIEFIENTESYILEKVDSQEIVLTVPESYEFSPASEEDIYYIFWTAAYDTLFVDVQENDCVPNGISALTEDEVKKIFIVKFLLEGQEEGADFYDITYDAFEIVTINGVKMYKLQGVFTWNDGSLTEDELENHGFSCYMTATKENLYFVSIISAEENFTQEAEMNEIIGSTYVNGTFFDGDKTTSKEDFTAKRPFSQAITEDATAYMDFYYGDDLYYEDEALSEEDLETYRKTVKIVCIVLILICAVPTVIVVAIAIVMIVKYSKNKKKLRELENKAFTQPVFNGNQPYNQPVVNTQPIVNTQPVINGEPTDISDK